MAPLRWRVPRHGAVARLQRCQSPGALGDRHADRREACARFLHALPGRIHDAPAPALVTRCGHGIDMHGRLPAPAAAAAAARAASVATAALRGLGHFDFDLATVDVLTVEA